MAEEHIKALYNAVKDKYKVGTYDYFRDALQNEDRRRAFYDALSKEYDLGDYDYFEDLVTLYSDSFYDRMMSFLGVSGYPRSKAELEATRKVREYYNSLFSGERIENPPTVEEMEYVRKQLETATKKFKPGLAGEFIIGAMSGFTGGLTELAGGEEPVEGGFFHEIARAGGHFAGFLLGPYKLVSLLMSPALATAPAVKTFQWVAKRFGPAAPRWLNEAVTLGIASAVGENKDLERIIEDPNFSSVMEHMANRFVALGTGAFTGVRFGVIRDKLGTYLGRAAANLAITNLTNLAAAGALGADVKLSDIVFSSLLDLWFSKKGVMPNEKELIMLERYAELMAEDKEFKDFATKVAKETSGVESREERVKRIKKVVDETKAEIKEELPEVGDKVDAPPEVVETAKQDVTRVKAKKGKGKAKKEEIDLQVALRLKDGSVIKGDKNAGIVTHAQLVNKYKIDPNDVVDTGWLHGDKYISYKPEAKIEEPAPEKAPEEKAPPKAKKRAKKGAKKKVEEVEEKVKEPAKPAKRTEKEIMEEFEDLRNQSIELHKMIHEEKDPDTKKKYIEWMQELVAEKGRLKQELEEVTGKRYIDIGWKFIESEGLTKASKKAKEKKKKRPVATETIEVDINELLDGRLVVSYQKGNVSSASYFESMEQAKRFAEFVRDNPELSMKELMEVGVAIRRGEKPVVEEEPVKKEPTREPTKKTKPAEKVELKIKTTQLPDGKVKINIEGGGKKREVYAFGMEKANEFIEFAKENPELALNQLINVGKVRLGKETVPEKAPPPKEEPAKSKASKPVIEEMPDGRYAVSYQVKGGIGVSAFDTLEQAEKFTRFIGENPGITDKEATTAANRIREGKEPAIRRKGPGQEEKPIRKELLDDIIEKAKATKVPMEGVRLPKDITNAEKRYLVEKGLTLHDVRGEMLATWSQAKRAEELQRKVTAKVEKKKKAQAAKEKEPWEMTRDEYAAFPDEKLEASYQKQKKDILEALETDKKIKADTYTNVARFKELEKLKSDKYREHKKAVREALARGEDVPKEVLDDYPDLARKYGKKGTAKKPAKKEKTISTQEVADEVSRTKEAKGGPKEKARQQKKVIEKIEKETKKKVEDLKPGDVIKTLAYGKVTVVDPNPKGKGNEKYIIAKSKAYDWEIRINKDVLGKDVIVYSTVEKGKITTADGEVIETDRGADNLDFSDPSPESLGFIAGKVPGRAKRLYKRFREQIMQDPDAGKVLDMYERAEAMSKEVRKTTLRRLRKLLVRWFVDTTGNFKRALEKAGRAGLKVIIKHDLVAGARSKAIKMYNEKFDTIYGGLSEVEVKILNMIISSRRTLAISKYKNIKHPDGLVDEHKNFLNMVPRKLLNKLNARADEYFKTMKEMLDLLLKEGIITPESYKALVSKGDYSPRVVLHHIDPDIVYRSGFGSGKLITVSSSGLKPLEEGTYGLLETDSQLLLMEVINRTLTRIARNEANKELYEFAKNNPNNGLVMPWKRNLKVPARHTRVNVMINGKPKSMILPNEYAREWVVRDSQISRELAATLKWLSGSVVLKPMATGINPEFILTNFPRDILHVWMTTAEYSKFMPLAALQMGSDLIKVAKDVWLRKGRFLDYIDEGGGMEFLTHQGRIDNPVTGKLRELQRILGYLGETSEVWVRLALRERTIKNRLKKGMTPEEARTEGTWVARNYLDFSQGGSFAKAVDNFVPYLNATIQGTRGILRHARQDKIGFTFKAAQLIALGASLYLAHRTNKEAMDDTDDFVKVNYFYFNLFPFKDKEGDTRWVQFTIAKDQGQRLFTTLGEALMAWYLGDDYKYSNIIMALKDSLPILPTENLPPTLAAAIGLIANKDLWRMRDIWPGPKVKLGEEWLEYTPHAFRQVGKIGVSPERSRFALAKLFTYGNIYTWAAGGIYKLIAGVTEDDESYYKTTEQIWASSPFIRKVTKVTDPRVRTRRYKETYGKEVTTEAFKITREFDMVLNKYFQGRATKEDILSALEKVPAEHKKRLLDRFERALKINVSGKKTFWVDLAESAPKLRAYIFWSEYLRKDKKGREELLKGMQLVPGIRSPEFDLELAKLMKMSKEKGEFK